MPQDPDRSGRTSSCARTRLHRCSGVQRAHATGAWQVDRNRVVARMVERVVEAGEFDRRTKSCAWAFCGRRVADVSDVLVSTYIDLGSQREASPLHRPRSNVAVGPGPLVDAQY